MRGSSVKIERLLPAVPPNQEVVRAKSYRSRTSSQRPPRKNSHRWRFARSRSAPFVESSSGGSRMSRAENRPRIMARLPTSPPSVPLGPSPSGCPTAGFSPAVRASVCEPGVPTQSDTDGSVVPVQVRSETDLRRSRGWHRCPPDPLPPPLHGFNPVHDQIKYYLLKLHSVTQY